MTEGSLFIVLVFPESWPPTQEQLIFKEKANGSLIELYGNRKGQLLLKIDTEIFKTQIIEFSKSKRALLSIIWNISKSKKISLYLNGNEIDDYENNNVFVVISKPEIHETKKSYELPESKKACKEWMSWRNERYGSQKMHAKKDRTLKPIEAQFKELENSLISIEHNINAFYHDEELLALNVLTFLRALLFWPDNKANNYNPLLFRLAGHLKLHLPVFAFKDRIKDLKENSLYNDATILRVNNHPSIIKKYPNQKLMDFQEWLNMTIIFDRTIGEKENFRWKDIIDDSANTIATHFDDDIPQIIEKLKKSSIWENSLFIDYILTICNTTLELGNFILRNKNSG